MITIVSALKSEIAPLLQRVPITEKRILASGSLYISDKIHFLRTGIGKQKAEKVFNLYLEQFRPEKVLNIGLAGKLNPDFKIGEIYCISRIFSADAEPIKINFHSQSKCASLLTVDQPVADISLRDKLHRQYNADLVDMEAYSIANTVRKKNISFNCVKIISDSADINTEKTFLENYRQLSKKLTEFVWKNEL